MDRKKIIYIGILLILTVIISITYFSYAFFTHRDEQSGKLNIVTGTLNYKIESNDLTNNSITLEAKKSKQIEIEITSLNSISSKYELYYTTTASNVVIGYSSNNDTPTGTIAADSKKTVKIVIKNKSNSSITITFGVEGGFNNNELVVGTGKQNINTQLNVCNLQENTVVFNETYATSTPYTFDAPCDGNYRIELWGTSGGGSRSNGSLTSSNAYGAYTAGDIFLSENNKLYLYIGQKGTDAVVGRNSAAAWNGGGLGTWDNKDDESAGGGGGATDIRFFGDNYIPTAAELAWNSSLGLNSRIMVAGGAGGNSWNFGGGSAGGLAGYDTSGATAGKQTTGFSFGQGKDGSGVADSDGVGGGGGGYYGGISNNTNGKSSGAGGSSFISGHAGSVAILEGSTTNPRTVKTGCATITGNNMLECSKHYSGLYFTNTIMIDGKGYSWTNAKGSLEQMPNPNGGFYASGVGNTGNGYARITYLGE